MLSSDFPGEVSGRSSVERVSPLLWKNRTKRRRASHPGEIYNEQGASEADIDSDSGYCSPKHNQAAGVTQRTTESTAASTVSRLLTLSCSHNSKHSPSVSAHHQSIHCTECIRTLHSWVGVGQGKRLKFNWVIGNKCSLNTSQSSDTQPSEGRREVLSFGDLSIRDDDLLLNIIKLNGTWPVVKIYNYNTATCLQKSWAGHSRCCRNCFLISGSYYSWQAPWMFIPRAASCQWGGVCFFFCVVQSNRKKWVPTVHLWVIVSNQVVTLEKPSSMKWLNRCICEENVRETWHFLHILQNCWCKWLPSHTTRELMRVLSSLLCFLCCTGGRGWCNDWWVWWFFLNEVSESVPSFRAVCLMHHIFLQADVGFFSLF